MYEFKTLEGVSPESLYPVFLAAFEDAPMPGSASPDAFRRILRDCGYLAEASMGAFDTGTGRPVSIILNGIHISSGGGAAYGIFTGTLPEYRRQGLASALLDRLIPLLREHQVTLYTTEILQENTAALALCRSHGFEITGEIATGLPSADDNREICQYTLALRL